MQKFARQAMFVAVATLLNVSVFAAGDTAAKVNGVAIPQALVDMRVKAVVNQGQPDTPELRKAIVDDMVNLEVLSQAASKKGLEKRPETALELRLARESALASAYVQDYLKNHPISEDMLKHEYENQQGKFGKTEYKVAHILVATEDEAKAIEAQLAKDADKFEAIAKEKSKDTGTAEHGGELGWNVPSNFVAPFANALTKLKKGEISAPVQSEFGWHIIKLEDMRELAPPPFEQVRAGLKQHLQQQALQKMVMDLRANAKVEIDK